jgi:ribosomal protein L21E
MAKYKVGDKVRIVSKNPNAIGFTDAMEKYLGKTLTVINVRERPYGLSTYNFKEATVGNLSMDLPRKVFHWNFAESWISGLAEPEREYTVELRFDGMTTTATLKRGGRDVKTAEARCNPKDTYSRAEGARVAVERLFEKKRKEDKPKESQREQGEPKVGDKFVVVQKRYIPRHSFAIGDIVTLEAIGAVDNIYCLGKKSQFVDDRDLKPYKEKSK